LLLSIFPCEPPLKAGNADAADEADQNAIDVHYLLSIHEPSPGPLEPRSVSL